MKAYEKTQNKSEWTDSVKCFLIVVSHNNPYCDKLLDGMNNYFLEHQMLPNGEINKAGVF
jgi:hypothetical protein